jgi:glycogen operon protein
MPDHRVSEGAPRPLGVTPDADGVNVAVGTRHGTRVWFCLFDETGAREIARVPLPERTGDVVHGHVAGVRPGARYGLRVEGPFAPEAGHRFNAHKLLLDPFATAIDRPFALHRSMFAYRVGHPDADLSFDDADSAPAMPKAIVSAPHALPPRRLHRANERVLYELHAKGFTARHPAVPQSLRGTLAGLAQPASITHLKRLGITTVEVMPLAAVLDERHLPPLGLSNYWGYNPAAFLAPDPRRAPGGFAEIAAAVATLADTGIETLIDVVLNHTAEGDELGPTVSLRGIDNALYHRLRAGDPRRYVDDAGCGNTLALERPLPLALALAALRTWATRTGVAGFRYDLATTLARRADGFDPDHPLLLALADDPVLAPLVHVVEPWDIGPGGYRLGGFAPGVMEWNDRYRDTARRFWRGDGGMLGDFATRIAGSSDVFGERRQVTDGVNFVTAHDGFTLADLVSHETKRNHANGEHNRDGTDANHSWAIGGEGPNTDAAVAAARARDVAGLLATLLLSRGTPMLAMGDEAGRAQGGNNNAYAQDGPVSWFDWEGMDDARVDLVAALTAARARHPALRGARRLTGAAIGGSDIPDVEWHALDGAPMTPALWEEPGRRGLVMVLAAPDRDAIDRVALVVNAAWEDADLSLPRPRDGHRWTREVATVETAAVGLAPARSVTLFAEEADPARARTGVGDDVVARVARAAGIAGEWWEVDGTHHRVTPETERALLSAMGLPVASAEDARVALHTLASERTRALPHHAAALVEEAATVTIPWRDGARERLVLRLEDGWEIAVAIEPGAGERVAPDRRRVALPALPLGRHVLRAVEWPDETCRLVVAPAACVSVAERTGRARVAGLGANTYALRDAEDGGIGNLGTLRRLAKRADRAGLHTLAIPPLHALFPTDPERASPYHPSDRRFRDVRHLDVRALHAAMPAVAPDLAALEGRIAEVRARPAIDHAAVWTIASAVARAAYAARDTLPEGARGAFAAYIEAGGEGLRRFALHDALAARFGGTWPGWPAEFRDPASPACAAFAARNREAIEAALFAQWLLDGQLAAAARAAPGVALIGDLAVGCAPDGAEAWANQALFMRGASVGAPPDPFSAAGQVWNLPPPNPLARRANGFDDVADLLAANLAHVGGLRVDHVMGLARLFVVPDGAPGSAGAYVAMDLDAHLAELKLASARANAIIVGEDLGTVPENFGAALARAGVLGMDVLLFAREGARYRDAGRFRAGAMATVTTHDLPTFAGWRRGLDLDERAALGHVADPTAARAERRDEIAALAATLRADPDDETGFAAAAHAHLATSPAAIILAQCDDLAGETVGVNLPGTDRERPNWRRRVATPVEDLFDGDRARAILAALTREAQP